jgi:hypothetical protein
MRSRINTTLQGLDLPLQCLELKLKADYTAIGFLQNQRFPTRSQPLHQLDISTCRHSLLFCGIFKLLESGIQIRSVTALNLVMCLLPQVTDVRIILTLVR